MAAPGKSLPTVTWDGSAELRLLLEVAQRAADPSRPPVHPPAGTNWPGVLQLAALHGLEAFLFREIRNSPVPIPPEVLGSLSRASAEITARNLGLGRETCTISSCLQAHRIPHLVYKGPQLGEFLYGTQSLRPASDIDLLVAATHANVALQALKQCGYVDPLKLNAGQIHACIRYGSEYSLLKHGIEVDLHWRPAPVVLSHSLDFDGLWNRTATTRFFDAQLPVPSPEDLLVLLCLHAGEHRWNQLSLFADMARLLSTTRDLNWELVRAHLRDENSRRSVDVTLLLLATQFGARVPRSLLRREAQVEIIAANVVSKFWPDPESAFNADSNFRWVLERCRGESMRARWRWIWNCTMNPTLADFQYFPLPAYLSMLYPGVRLFRLALRGNRKRAESVTSI